MTLQDTVEREAGTLPLGRLGAILLRNWLLIIVTIALGAALGAGAASLMQPRYQATATQFIRADDGSASYQSAQFAISRAKSYPSFIYSNQVLSGVYQDLHGELDIPTLRDNLSATNPIDSQLVMVTAEADSPEQAQQVANSAARHLTDFILQIETVKGVSPIRVQMTVDATLPKVPTSPQRMFLLIIGAAIGLVAGVAISVVRSYLPGRRRTTDEQPSKNTGETAAEPRPRFWQRLVRLPKARVPKAKVAKATAPSAASIMAALAGELAGTESGRPIDPGQTATDRPEADRPAINGKPRALPRPADGAIPAEPAPNGRPVANGKARALPEPSDELTHEEPTADERIDAQPAAVASGKPRVTNGRSRGTNGKSRGGPKPRPLPEASEELAPEPLAEVVVPSGSGSEPVELDDLGLGHAPQASPDDSIAEADLSANDLVEQVRALYDRLATPSVGPRG